MTLGQAQIATFRQAACPAKQSRPALHQQLEVVPPARAEGRGNDAPTGLLDQDLGFLGVALLFAAVPLLLLFWGRSTGHSVASTTTTCSCHWLWVSAFLPGSVNRPERVKASSTARIVRDTAASLRP